MTEQLSTKTDFPGESRPAAGFEARDFPLENIPAEIPRKIADSPNFMLYVERARSGWSSRQLSEFGERYCGERISHVTFQALIRLLPPSERLPTHYREVYLNGIDAKLDALAEMQNLIAVQRERVTQALAREAQAAGGDGQERRPSAETQKVIDSLHTMTKDLAMLQLHLGILTPERAREAHIIDAGQTTSEETFREFCARATPEQKAMAQQMLEMYEGMFQVELPVVTDEVSVESWAMVCEAWETPLLSVVDAVEVTERFGVSVD